MSRPMLAFGGLLVAASATGYLQLQAAQGGSTAVRTVAPRPTVLAQAAQPAVAAAAVTPADTRALLNKYCVACHNERLKSGGMVLDKIDTADFSGGAETWEKVLRKLHTQEMPPVGRPRPDQATYTALTHYFESSLDRAAEARPNPGRVPIHRLNRTEYGNAVRVLLGLEVSGRDLLPPDEADREGLDRKSVV